MKNIWNNKYVLIGLGLVIGAAIGWWMKPPNNHSTESSEIQAVDTSAHQVWTCSMHPQIRQNEPGDCPICGMDLIPVESAENEELDPMAVSMSPVAMQLAQVQTAVVGTGSAEKSIRLYGKVQADERLLYTQSSHIPGRIEKLNVNFTGDFVTEGQEIAYIYSPDLVTAQEELFEARKIKEIQPALFHAAKEKLKNWKLTDEQIDRILASGNTINQFPILANVSGYVTQKMVNLGDYVVKGDPIYEISDLSKVWVLFDVYESDLTWVKNGARLTFTVESIPGKTFNGRISYIDPVIDPKTRVTKARVETVNRNFQLKPEMFVSGTLEAKASNSQNAITVPKSAVMWTGKRSLVYVMQTSAQGVNFQMREVTLGAELGKSYIIESGLEPGEEIAVNGTFSIDAAAQLAGKPSMMSPEGGAAMTGHNHGGSAKGTESGKPTIEKSTISAEAKQSLQPLFQAYFNMKEALADDAIEKAKSAGKGMTDALGKVDMGLFQGDAHRIWMGYASELQNNLHRISGLNDIEAFRKGFIALSGTMIGIAESFDPMSSTIYVQRCPMANSNDGADWLSLDEEIRNPYFGASMLTCGEVTKILE